MEQNNSIETPNIVKEFIHLKENEGVDLTSSITLNQLKKITINFQEGDVINIEGELYLIVKTKIGNTDKLRITLRMVKNIK